MKKNDRADMIVGSAFSLLGLGIFFYARSNYDMGELTNMGSGFFPAILGITMALLGLIVTISSIGIQAPKREFNIRTTFFVTLSIIAFALLIERLGALPAIFALVLIASLAEKRSSWPKKLLLAAVLFCIAYLIFKVMLSMNFSLVHGVL